MQGGRRGGDNVFNPFAGFGGHESLISSVFGGRDPFDDPFFTSPFGGSLFGRNAEPRIFRSPFGGSPFGSMLESSIFGARGNPTMNPPGFLEHQNPMPRTQAHPQQSYIQRGPVITEIDSDDEKEENEGATQRTENPRKHNRSGKEPFVEYPDDDDDEERSKQIQFRNQYNMSNMPSQPQSHSFSFHSSTVSYGGGNGTYYTKSSTKRTGSDGVAFEEHKEADSTTGQAYHQVSRGLYNKGHTLTRNLNQDGSVQSTQTLHNLNQDELPNFQKQWKGKAEEHLPGVSERLSGLANTGVIGVGQDRHADRGGRALPSTERSQPQRPQPNPKRVRTSIPTAP